MRPEAQADGVLGNHNARTDEQVDARAYLRARLMDVFMGDWDRHAAQWHWLRFDEGGRRDWRAVPVDRD